MKKTTKKLVLTTLTIATVVIPAAHYPTAIYRTIDNTAQLDAKRAFQAKLQSLSQTQTFVSEIPTMMSGNNGQVFEIIQQESEEANAVEDIQDVEDTTVETTNRGSAADRFFQSAYDKVGAESESDLEKDDFVPSQDLQDILDELEKGDSPILVDPTINPTTEETLEGINNVSEADLTGQSNETNVATASSIFATAMILGAAVVIVGAVHLRRRLDGERVRQLGTRIIQDKYFIGKAEKLSELDKKIAKKEASGKNVSTSLQQKRDKIALQVTENSLNSIDNISPKRLSKYGYYAKWRKYWGYISNSLDAHGYKQLCKGLYEYGNYLNGDVTSKTAQRHLKDAISCFNSITNQIESNVYFGPWAIPNDSAGIEKQVKLSTIPIFPFRYVQNQGLEITVEQKADLEDFFDEVFAQKAHNEKDVTYGTISYYREDSETPNQMKYAFDNAEASKLIKSKLITLVPENATKIVIQETNKGAMKSKAKTISTSYSTPAKIKAAKEKAEETIERFNKTYEITNTQTNSIDNGKGME